jgi:hypothetical protein
MQSAGKLTRKQEALISALLTAPSLAAAAQQAGLSEVIAWRWLKDATLQANYRDARRALVQHAIAQVQRATGEAVETLRSVMQDAEAPASARVSAAKAISGPPSQASQWRTWQPALPPSTRKDRSDAPAAVGGRVTRLEVQQRPWVVADDMRHARGSEDLSAVIIPRSNDQKTSLIGEA